MGQRLGQHFLVDRGVLNTIVNAGEVAASDLVLEIGPGKGVLTEELVKRAGWVVAIEKDEGLARTLRPALGAPENLEIITGDAVAVDLPAIIKSSFRGQPFGLDEESRDMSDSEPRRGPSALPVAEPLDDDFCRRFRSWKLIANIPYEITSPLLFLLFDIELQPERVVLLIQKAVADRIVSPPGKKARSILSVFGQLYAEIELICAVPPKAFNPPPSVESAVIRLIPYPADSKQRQLLASKDFRRLVKAGFSQKRKQLKNALSAVYHLPSDDAVAWLSAASLDSTVRAEELSLKDWDTLFSKRDSLPPATASE